jgi:hypothetical protein
MQTAETLFEHTLAWLRTHYATYTFYVERDIVWTLQTHLTDVIRGDSLPFAVFNDFPILSGNNRSLSTDLVLLSPDRTIRVAVEFKYEPSHARTDIQREKLPVVFWGREGVEKDIQRIYQFVREGKAQVAYSIFIDEGGYFRKRTPHDQSVWTEWENGVWVLQSKAAAADIAAH